MALCYKASMKPDQAEQNLQVIRTLMERSTLYRRALGPIMFVTGLLGALAALIGFYSRLSFVPYWIGVSIIILVVAFVLVRRQALTDREPVWSPPTKRVAQALLPALLSGALLTYVCLGEGLQEPRLFVVGWMMLYGCALHAAGFFAPQGIRRLGWLFIVGAIACACISIPPNVTMGLSFGGFHLAYGIYLFATKKP